MYEGEKMPKDKKSLAYSLSFVSQDKTLTDQEIDSEFQELLGHLKGSVGAELR
jgi:phenylalanyl-tRNA synthetase beta chain